MPTRKYNTEEERQAAKKLSQKKYRESHAELCTIRVAASKKKRWDNDHEYRAMRLIQMKEYNFQRTVEKQKEKYEFLKLKFEENN